jgi:hypothetical protein
MQRLNLPPVPPVTAQGFLDPVWPRWLQQLREYILKLMPKPAYGAFEDTTTQTAAANTATPITWNTTNYSADVAIDGTPSQIVFPTAGNYNMEFSLQFQNSSTAADNVTVWIRINGVDVVDSAGIGTVPAKHGSVPGAMILSWTEVLTLAAGDKVQMLWSTDSGTSSLVTYAAGTAPVHPRSPCAAITFVQVA